MKEHSFFMQKALDLAAQGAEAGEVPVGALLVCENRIVAKAHNQTELLCDATAHAEMLVLTSGFAHFQSKYLKDCTLYVSLEPCPMCAAAMYWAQLGRVVWGANDPKKGFSLFSPSLIHPSTEVVSGIMAADSAALLKNFFTERR